MIIKVANGNTSQEEVYSFTQKQICIGRNPTSSAFIQIPSETVSRNHLKVRIRKSIIEINDLHSSNGTFIGNDQLQPGQWRTVKFFDKVKLAEFQGLLTFQVRQASLPKKQNQNNHIKAKKQEFSSDSQSQSRSRSRQKQKRVLPFKVSESSLKMLKDMTINGKSKEERIKFLRLMGISKAEQYWEELEDLVKGKKSSRDVKKTSEELERQFSQSRSGFEKRGLGK